MHDLIADPHNADEPLLECERPRVYIPLTFLGGFYGGFTYAVRGGVFCNVQTANFVLCAIALANADWGRRSTT